MGTSWRQVSAVCSAVGRGWKLGCGQSSAKGLGSDPTPEEAPSTSWASATEREPHLPHVHSGRLRSEAQSCLSLSLPTLGMVTGSACARVLISVVTVIAGVCACVQPSPLQTSAPPPGGQMHNQGHHRHCPTLCQCLVGTTLVSGLLAQCLSTRHRKTG